MGRRPFSVARHEAIKHAMADGLRMVDDLEVTVEPFIRGTTRRNNIAVRHLGDHDSGAAAEEYDLAVCSITAPSHAGQFALRHRDGDRPLTTVLGFINRVLAAKANRKVWNLPDRADGSDLATDAIDAPFIPLIMSTGGILEAGTREKIREWKSWGIPSTMYAWMMMVMAVRLARSRAKTFRRDE